MSARDILASRLFYAFVAGIAVGCACTTFVLLGAGIVVGVWFTSLGAFSAALLASISTLARRMR